MPASEERTGVPFDLTPARRVRCDDCGRWVTVRRMPDDWPLDWWSHKLEGQRSMCGPR